MNMRTWTIVMLAAVMSTSVFAIGMIGPPTAETQQGRFGFGLNYSYTRENVKNATPKISWVEFGGANLYEDLVAVGWQVTDTSTYAANRLTGERLETGFAWDSPNVDADGLPIMLPYDASVAADRVVLFSKVKFDKLRTNRYFGTFSYGLTDNWEISATLGFAKVKTGAAWDSETWGLAPADLWWTRSDRFAFDDSSPFYGFGTKYTFYRQDNFKIGASFNMNWLKAEGNARYSNTWEEAGLPAGDYDRESESRRDKYSAKYYEMTLAVGPTVDMGGWSLYGGPFLYYMNGTLKASTVERESGEWRNTAFDMGGDWEDISVMRMSARMRARSNFGGFVGAQIPLGANSNFGVEFATTGRGYAVSTGLGFGF